MHPSKTSLPELDGATLDFIFERVYVGYYMDNTVTAPTEEEKLLSDFFEVLKALQMFNYQYRTKEALQVYKITRRVFEVDLTSNSEGGILWLTLLLALKQLYGLNDRELLQCARNITVRK